MDVKKWLQSLNLMIIFGLSFASISSGQSPASPSLPTDIVFVGGLWDETPHTQLDALALLDGKTLEITEIYRDTRHLVSLKPVSWSPQGDRLAFLSIQRGSNYAEVCILAMSDSLKTCFDDKMIYSADVNYSVTWSEDGQKVYFITQEQQAQRLIEADVLTGKTLQTLYETEYSRGEAWGRPPIPPTIAWTPKLSHIAVGIGYHNTPPGMLVDLRTGEDIALSQILKPYLGEPVEQAQASNAYICPEFSPAGDYLVGIIPTAYSIAESTSNDLVIFDVAEKTIRLIENPGYYAYCPAWTKDEKGFYFVATKAFPTSLEEELQTTIFFYSLVDDVLAEYNHSASVNSSLTLSPNGTHIAFETIDYLNDIRPAPVINILYPNGTIRSFSDPYFTTRDPVWRPTLGNP